MEEASASHGKVLRSLKKLRVPGYGTVVEEKNNRLELPNMHFHENRKGVEQRKQSLCYFDAIVHAGHVPRVLIEVVDNSPTGPNGITGLTVNVDRIAEEHRTNIDLIFIVLAEMKDFYCGRCCKGHRLSNMRKRPCLKRCLGENPDNDVFRRLIHEGKAAKFKKVLIDYPISNYLRNISPPSVVFINATKVATAWDTYEGHVLRLIEREIVEIISSDRRGEARLMGVRELMPELSEVHDELVRDERGLPPPGSEVTWESPNGQQLVTIKNRGRHNTRIRFLDGRTKRVPNRELKW